VNMAPESVVERIVREGSFSVPFNAASPLTYQQRETLKSEGWAIVAAVGLHIHFRANALLAVIEAHYWRADEVLQTQPLAFRRRVHGRRYSPGYELDIDVYTKHWLWANGAKVKEQDVVKFVQDEFGYQPERSRFLPEGRTIYVDWKSTTR
jgi:hypothetical protein